MAERGNIQRELIAKAARIFGNDAEHLVFAGGCVLALYANACHGPSRAELRQTRDVDCVSTLLPWSRQLQKLAELCKNKILRPDQDIQCRYHVAGENFPIDILSPEGLNVGGSSKWLSRGCEHAESYEAAPGLQVRALPPPYFLLAKLETARNRARSVEDSHDVEDMITLAAEVPDLLERIKKAGLRHNTREEIEKLKQTLNIRHIADMVLYHLHPDDRGLRQQIVELFEKLESGR